jgi:signal transduction histidine kinase
MTSIDQDMIRSESRSFTTKPPGEGTGLGLSISCDIINQQHGGTIAVDSEKAYLPNSRCTCRNRQRPGQAASPGVVASARFHGGRLYGVGVSSAGSLIPISR